jgi:hypothetical protein
VPQIAVNQYVVVNLNGTRQLGLVQEVMGSVYEVAILRKLAAFNTFAYPEPDPESGEHRTTTIIYAEIVAQVQAPLPTTTAGRLYMLSAQDSVFMR